MPKLKITFTNSERDGQIYVAGVNWTLMLLCVAVTGGFRGNLESISQAYGARWRPRLSRAASARPSPARGAQQMSRRRALGAAPQRSASSRLVSCRALAAWLATPRVGHALRSKLAAPPQA